MREAADGRADICCHAVGPAGFDQVVQKDAKRSLTTTGHASTCATLSRTSGGIHARASCSYRLGGGERDYHGDTGARRRARWTMPLTRLPYRKVRRTRVRASSCGRCFPPRL